MSHRLNFPNGVLDHIDPDLGGSVCRVVDMGDCMQHTSVSQIRQEEPGGSKIGAPPPGMEVSIYMADDGISPPLAINLCRHTVSGRKSSQD